MQIGIQLSSVRALMQKEPDVRTTLHTLAESGYRTAQIQWTGRDVRAESLAAALRETGIRALSVQDFTHAVLTDSDYYFRLADACGFADITVSGIPEEELSVEGIRRFAARLAPLHRRVLAEGGTLSFHPRMQELAPVEGIPALQRLLDESDPSLRVLPDVNHIVRAGLDAVRFLRSIAGRADMIHCKDAAAPTPKSPMTPVGEGCVDWDSVLSTAREIGIHTALVEQESWVGSPFADLARGGRYLLGLDTGYHF